MKHISIFSIITSRLSWPIIAAVACAVHLQAATPDWWGNQGFLSANEPKNDLSAIIQGQLKHATAKAIAQLNSLEPNGAGAELNTLLSEWTDQHPSSNDTAVICLGQLQYVSGKIFDRLIALGYDRPLTPGDANTRPSIFLAQWHQQSHSEGLAVPNQGQLKYLFSFTFDTSLVGKHPDIDGDGVLNEQDAYPFDFNNS